MPNRKFLVEYTSVDTDQMNLITFGMSAVSLVTAVIQLAMISSTMAEDIYRNYLGKVACCHFSLVSWPCLRTFVARVHFGIVLSATPR
jgi:hypothetical protein